MSVFVCAGVAKDADGAQKGDDGAQNPGQQPARAPAWK